MTPAAWLVLALFVLCLVSSVVLAWMETRGGLPKPRKLTPQFEPNADSSMTGLDEAFAAIQEVVHEQYPGVEADVLSAYVQFYGKDDTIISTSVPEGYIQKANGSEARINGTVELQKSGLINTDKTFIVKVRQLHYTDGSLKSAGMTALFHEFAEHVVPYIMTHDWNTEHVVKWIILTGDMAARYRTKMKGKTL